MARPLIRYDVFMWTFFLVTTTIFIYDRFVTNVWPRQSLATSVIPRPGNDAFDLKPGPGSYTAYQIVARFTGRYSIACLNFLFFTMMHTTHDIVANSWIGRYVINMEESKAQRTTMHKWLGISLSILTIFHVWSIMFPVWFSGFGLRVVPHERIGLPLSGYAPAGMKDVDVTIQLVSMEVDDLWRLILMTVILGPLMYYSVKAMASNYRIGVRVHQFIMLMFFVDIVRRHTHPHSWILNIPVFVLWVLDHFVGLVYCHERVEMRSIPVGKDYVLLLWNSRFASSNSVGEVYRMRLPNDKSCYRVERKHPFTTFSLRGANFSSAAFTADGMFEIQGNKVVPDNDRKPADLRDLETLPSLVTEDWNRAAIIRTYDQARSHTKNFRLEPGESKLSLHTWGPMIENSVASVLGAKNTQVVAIGGGSGCAYMLDLVFKLASELTTPSESIFSTRVLLILCTRDAAVAKLFCNIVDNLLTRNPELKKIVKVQVAVSSVKDPQVGAAQMSFGWRAQQESKLHKLKEIQAPEAQVGDDLSEQDLVLGRPSLDALLANFIQGRNDAKVKTHVFCQGGPGLQKAARAAARFNMCNYHEAQAFDKPPRTPQRTVLEPSSVEKV